MSEGEFKKRIGIRVSQLFDTLKEHENAIKDGLITIEMHREILNFIVVEAQQEWRDTDNYDKAKDELGNIVAFGHKLTHDEAIRLLQYQLRRKNAWAHRWLGGEKAE